MASESETIIHRVITIIEPQSLVVFGSIALLTMVGATASTHERDEGWDNFLFVYRLRQRSSRLFGGQILFFAALTVLPRSILKNRKNSTVSSKPTSIFYDDDTCSHLQYAYLISTVDHY